MLDRTTRKQDDACKRCGAGPVIMVVGRVGRLDRGHVDIYRCDACGHLSQRDAPHSAGKT
jgi:hypothetical protein